MAQYVVTRPFAAEGPGSARGEIVDVSDWPERRVRQLIEQRYLGAVSQDAPTSTRNRRKE